MEIVINACYGGFGLSYDAVMEIAELKGIELYPFVNKRDERGNTDFKHFEPYKPGMEYYTLHYATRPLNEDGSYINESYYHDYEIKRDDKDLVSVVKKLGDKANGSCAKLKVINIPDGVEWTIEEYDGNEWVSEVHKTWS